MPKAWEAGSVGEKPSLWFLPEEVLSRNEAWLILPFCQLWFLLGFSFRGFMPLKQTSSLRFIEEHARNAEFQAHRL